MISKMKKRRGSVLSISIIVMLLMAILSGATFGLAYINRRSTERQIEIFKARVAARSLLYSVGSVISDDLSAGTRWITDEQLTTGRTGTFSDGALKADVIIK